MASAISAIRVPNRNFLAGMKSTRFYNKHHKLHNSLFDPINNRLDKPEYRFVVEVQHLFDQQLRGFED